MGRGVGWERFFYKKKGEGEGKYIFFRYQKGQEEVWEREKERPLKGKKGTKPMNKAPFKKARAL